MIVALTGASGFLGRELVAALERQGCALRVLSRSDLALPARIVVHGNLLDSHACRRLVKGAAVVVHAAGLVRSPDTAALHQVNHHGTCVLAEASMDAGVRRFVHVSSAGVYGSPDTRVNERSPLRPTNAYERSKADAERSLWALGDRLPVVIARPSSVVGPSRSGRPLLRLMRRLRKGPIWASADARANYVDVASVGRAIAALAYVPDPPDAVILNQGRPLTAFLSMVAEAAGVKASVRLFPQTFEQVARPAVSVMARHVAAAGRLWGVLDRSDFATLHGDWLASVEAVPNLPAALAGVAARYQAEGLL